MTAFTFHLNDGFTERSDTVPGDDIENLDEARKAVAQLGSEALRKLSRSSSYGGTWKFGAKDDAGITVCELTIVAR